MGWFGFGKEAKKTVAQLKAANIRMSKKEDVEATLAVMIGGMHADGKVTDEEQSQFALQLEHNEMFEGYPADEIGKFSDRVFGYYKMGALMGEKKVIDELKDVSSDKEVGKNILTVLHSMLVSDGDSDKPLEGKEAAYFDKICKVFSITPKEILG